VLADVREDVKLGGSDRIVRSLSVLHRLSESGVEVEPERSAAVAALARSAERAQGSGDLAEFEADLALLDVEAPEEEALLRASFSLAWGEPAEARAWLELSGSFSETPFAEQLRCAEAVEETDSGEARCRCGSAASLSSDLLRKWADLALDEGDYSSAASAWERVLRSDPRDSLARQGRALALLRGGDPRGALREVESARRLGIAFSRDLEDEIRRSRR
jgi:tetratricopeptide (TPR) repeat protein